MAEIDLTDRTDPSEPAPEREILTGERCGGATRELATEIAADGFRPDVVLATDRWINFSWSCQDPVVAVDNRDA